MLEMEEMAEVARFAPMPLATNMVTIAFGHLPRTVELKALQVLGIVFIAFIVGWAICMTALVVM